MFYYIIHIWLIHLFALLLVVLQGHPWTDMTAFTSWVDVMPNLKGYGLSLGGSLYCLALADRSIISLMQKI